jgi:hypothetical protein
MLESPNQVVKERESMSMLTVSRKVLCVGSLATTAAALLVLTLWGPPLRAGEPSPEGDAELNRAREQVKMIDELYKNAVVSITNKYNGPPAIKVAKDVFAAMEKNGWHKAKLVDATGAPQNEANLPQTAFEKRAVKAIRAGQPYYEEVSGEGLDRTLYAATIVPAVTGKCATCHGVNQGDLLGFIRYEMPVK